MGDRTPPDPEPLTILSRTSRTQSKLMGRATIETMTRHPIHGALFLLLGCGDKPSEPHPTRTGAWFGTDLHVHTSLGSNDTDGESGVSAQVSMARERGLSLLAITDHSNAAGSMDCATGDVEDCPNQGPEFPAQEAAHAASGDGLSVVVGVEISPVESLDNTMVPTGHVGCIPRSGDPFSAVDEAVIDRPAGSVSGGAGVEWCQARGGFAVINHPITAAGWIAYDWTSDAYDALEIFNGGARFDAGDAQSFAAWVCDLSQGRTVVPVGGSDCHAASTPLPPPEILDQALGLPTTWVWAENDDRDSLLDALAAGRVVVADPRNWIDLEVSDREQVVGPGEILSTTEDEVKVTVSVTTTVGDLLLQVLEITAETCTSDTRQTDGEPPEIDPVVLMEQDVSQGFTGEVTLDLPVSEGRLVLARLWPRTDSMLAVDGVAITAPVRVAVR